MIPNTIHYCWFGGGSMPDEAVRCMESWHRLMPGCRYRRWDEETFDVGSHPYTREAYAAGRYAFVSDYVRLWALEREGGVYFDTDVELLQPLDPLLTLRAFAGFEGSKHLPVGTCLLASEAHGAWVSEMLEAYKDRHFLRADGSLDLTTNVQVLTARMAERGLRQDGSEQDYRDLHLFPVEYFSPRRTTGEYICTANTYADHLGLASWDGAAKGWKETVRTLVGQKNMTRLIKLKRKLIG